MSEQLIANRMISSLQGGWREMLLADLVYKLLAFVVLTPLFGLLLRGLLWASGHAVLTDVDIPLFFTGPFGWFSAVLLGAVWLGISAMEQVSLLATLAARHTGHVLGVRGALEFAGYRAIAILRLTGRVVVRLILLVVPVAITAWLVYEQLLTEYDINFYLKERPPEFLLAMSIGAALSLVLFVLVVRFFSGSFLALQLVIFDSTSPKSALSTSKVLVAGKRGRVVLWLLSWILTFLALQLSASFCIGWLGQQVIPTEVGSLASLASRVGVMLVLVGVTSLLLNVVGVCYLAALLFEGYRELRTDAENVLAKANVMPKQWVQHSKWLSRTRIAVALPVMFAGAVLLGYLAIGRLKTEDSTQVMAHRGASASAPENTMAALRQAILDGADWVEIDVQETKDGQVVVLHDSDFMKLAANPLKIWDATAIDLEGIDIGGWFDDSFANERIPTLLDVLELCKGKVGVIIELKYYGHDQSLEERVIKIVEDQEMSEQIMVMSLKSDRVERVKKLRPAWKCGVLMSVSLGDVKNIEADFLAVNASFVGRSFVNRVHKSGKQVFVWTVNDAAEMCTLMNCGVDGILTDRPALAKKVLLERAEMTGSERLLVEIADWAGHKSKQVEQ